MMLNLLPKVLLRVNLMTFVIIQRSLIKKVEKTVIKHPWLNCQDVDFKSPVKQTVETKSYDTYDNSKISERELKKVAIKYHCLQSETSIKLSPSDKGNEPHIKQKFLKNVDNKSPTIQTVESKFHDTFDNSKKSDKELKKTGVKQPCLKSKTTIKFSPGEEIKESAAEKNKLHNYTDLSTKKVFSADIESPVKKRRKLSEKSPFKNESSETLKDSPLDTINAITKSPHKKLDMFQSSVHLIDHSPMNKSYVFKNDDIKLGSSYDLEKNTMLNEINFVDPSKNVEKHGELTYTESINISSSKNTNSLKKKKKKKKKKHSHSIQDLSNSVEIHRKKCKKSCHRENSSSSFLSSLQKNSDTQSSIKQQLQNGSKDSSCSTFGLNQIKNDSKTLLSGKNDSSDFKTNIQINSGANVNDGNTNNISVLENKITKTSERVVPSNCVSFNVQASVHNCKKSAENNEISAINFDQEKLADKDDSLIKNFSNNQLKMMDKDDKKISGNNLLSEALVNDKELCNPNIIISENIKVERKIDLPLKENDTQIYSHQHYTVKATDALVKDTSIEENDKVPLTGLFKKSAVSATEFENSFNLDNSQNNAQQVHARRNSCQSSISEDENALVIADDEDTQPISEFETDIQSKTDETIVADPENSTVENKNEVPLSAKIKSPSVKSKQKKRKNSKTPNVKRTKSKSFEEECTCNIYTIANVLDDIKKMKIEAMLTNHSNYKLLQHKLINALINPANAPNTISALYQVFSFLSSSKLNPLVSYPVKKNISVFYPPAENCIVEALIKVEHKKKIHLEGLISSAITTLYYLVLDKKTISKTGLGALCRIFTQLCKYTKNEQKPISLCCDLIKEQHPFAPVLIAFIMGVWLELFITKDEFKIQLLTSLYFGIQKKPSTVTSADWNACKEIFHMAPYPEQDIERATDFIIDCMKLLINDSPTISDQWTKDQMIIFAVTKGWIWTQENVVNFAVDSVMHYAREENNERAFIYFAELCADIGKLAPNDCLTILQVLSSLFLEDYDFDYVKKHAAHSLFTVVLFKRAPIPEILTQYIQENASQLNESNIELCLRRRCIADETELTENDIFII